MLEHLFLGDYKTKPPTLDNDPLGMRAYFFNRLFELARTVEVEVKVVNDGEEEFNADVRVEFPDDQNERLLDLFSMFDKGRLRSLVAVADEYVRQAKDQIKEIAGRNGESDQGVNFAEQVIVTASVAISTQIRNTVKGILEGMTDVEDATKGNGDACDEGENPDYEFDIPELHDWRGDSDTGEDENDAEFRDENLQATLANLDSERDRMSFLDVDESIIEAAEGVSVDLQRLRIEYDAIQNHLDSLLDIHRTDDTTPEYQRVQRAILKRLPEVTSGYATMREVLSLRGEPSISALLSRLPEAQANYCFATVFENIAQDALYGVEAFSDMVDASIGDRAADERAEVIMATYVDYLKDHYGLS